MFVRALRQQLGEAGEPQVGARCTLPDGRPGVVYIDGSCGENFAPYSPPECTTTTGGRGELDAWGNCWPEGTIPDAPTQPDPTDGAACTQIANGQPGVLIGGRCVPPGFVAPGATDLHPERWDVDACEYTVAYGDTYVGIAKTYLDPTGARWRELWAQNRAKTPDPDTLYPGQVLDLSGDACENMRRWLNRGGPNVNPSELPEEPVGDFARSWWGKVLLAGAAAGALYWMS